MPNTTLRQETGHVTGSHAEEGIVSARDAKSPPITPPWGWGEKLSPSDGGGVI